MRRGIKSTGFRQIARAKQICGLRLLSNQKRGIKTIFNHSRNRHARYVAHATSLEEEDKLIEAGFEFVRYS